MGMGLSDAVIWALYSRLHHPATSSSSRRNGRIEGEAERGRATTAREHCSSPSSCSSPSPAAPSRPQEGEGGRKSQQSFPPSFKNDRRAMMTREKTRPFPLLSLPLDLLHHLSAFLPPSAQVALRLTSRGLFSSLPSVPRSRKDSRAEAEMWFGNMPPVDEFEECEGKAIRFHFEEILERPGGGGYWGKSRAEKERERRERLRDKRRKSFCEDEELSAIRSIDETKTTGKWKGRESREYEKDKGRMRCALCKALYPTSLFDRAGFVSLDVNDGSGEEGQTETQASTRSMLNLRNRVCKWHDASFYRTVKRGSKASNHGEKTVEGWKLEEACMHCGAVLSWERCKCDCASCWKREVWCYTRVLEEEEERVKDDVYLRWFF